jgi:ketosteroid isomerase-like protein
VNGGPHAASGLVAIKRDSYSGCDVRFERAQSIHKEMRPMKSFIATVLLACAFVVPAWADSSQKSSADASAVAAIKQLGQDIGDAMIALDIEKLDRMYGDDWVSVGKSGTVHTKEMLLRDMKDAKKRLTWFELRPIDVQVFGDVAIQQGNVIERWVGEGKESELEVVYADILKKREGRWVLVHSMSSRVK